MPQEGEPCGLGLRACTLPDPTLESMQLGTYNGKRHVLGLTALHKAQPLCSHCVHLRPLCSQLWGPHTYGGEQDSPGPAREMDTQQSFMAG